ncbi:hypothetical protein [Brachybacterium sp. Z12]|uniref:hypothetical protein n=1 Tax=Brachybacterium sp. Z12 TaxID=2759167 RepID=UPI00223C1C43|nr:hypothetical protein [Brachybacterium sp. Z12]
MRHQLIDSNRLFVDTRTGAVAILGIGVEAAAHPGLDRSREVASFQDTAALVALLYRALTGRSPQHDASGDVPRPSTVVDTEIPADLDLLCDLVLNESADDIPETTRGLIEALEPWQSIPVTLEAYPRAAPAAPAVDEPVSQEGMVEEGSAPADALRDDPSPSPSAEPDMADEDELDSTALMDSVPDELPDEDTVVRAPEPSVPSVPELPAAAGAASAVGMAGAGAAAVAAESAESTESAEPAEQRDQDDADGEEATVAEQRADEAEQQRAAQAAEEKAQRASEEAKSLVTDLRLDQKRSSTAFPGQLDLALPSPEEPPAAPDSPSAAGAGTLAAGGLAAGAAGTTGDSPQPQDSELPARSSGTQWPLAGDAEQGERTALAPLQSPDGSDGRAQQPSDAPSESSTASTPDHSVPTPTHPVVHSAGSQSPSPVPVAGRAAPVAAARGDEPIVIHGRDRSLLEETPEESTVPSSRGSLLRDVVGVAVDADAPGTFAMGPQDHEKRSLQSQWIIIGGAIVVMVALVFALTSITRDIGGLLDDPLATATPPSSTAPTEEDTGEAPVEPTEEATEEPELPAPNSPAWSCSLRAATGNRTTRISRSG